MGSGALRSGEVAPRTSPNVKGKSLGAVLSVVSRWYFDERDRADGDGQAERLEARDVATPLPGGVTVVGTEAWPTTPVDPVEVRTN